MDRTITFDRGALTRRRILSGYSIRKLAQVAGMSFSHLAAIERGDSDPSPATAKRLADALEIPVDDLYVEEVSA